MKSKLVSRKDWTSTVCLREGYNRKLGQPGLIYIVVEITFVGDIRHSLNLGEGITCSRVDRETEGVIETEDDREGTTFYMKTISFRTRDAWPSALDVSRFPNSSHL